MHPSKRWFKLPKEKKKFPEIIHFTINFQVTEWIWIKFMESDSIDDFLFVLSITLVTIMNTMQIILYPTHNCFRGLHSTWPNDPVFSKTPSPKLLHSLAKRVPQYLLKVCMEVMATNYHNISSCHWKSHNCYPTAIFRDKMSTLHMKIMVQHQSQPVFNLATT